MSRTEVRSDSGHQLATHAFAPAPAVFFRCVAKQVRADGCEQLTRFHRGEVDSRQVSKYQGRFVSLTERRISLKTLAA